MAASDPRWRKGYYSRPELPEGLTWYLEAFFDLSADRSEAAAAIPFLPIAIYADRHGLVDEAFDRFKLLIRRIDNAYVAHVIRKQKEAARPR